MFISKFSLFVYVFMCKTAILNQLVMYRCIRRLCGPVIFMDSVKTMKLSFLLVALAASAQGQRPSFAGSRPIGYPELAVTTESLGDRFGEVDGTTQKLPIEANGDKALVDRLSKLPIDKQPFWFINWQALEANRQNPQTYPQRPNPFIDPQLNNVNNVNAGNSNPNGGVTSGGSPNLAGGGNVNVNGGSGGNPNLSNTGISSFGLSGNPNLASSGNPSFSSSGIQNFGNSGNPNLGGSSNQNLENAIMSAFGANPNLGGNGNPNLAGSGNQNFGNNGNPNRGNTGASNFAVPATSNTGNFDLTDRFSVPSNPSSVDPNFGVPGNANFGNRGGSNGIVGNPNRGTNGNSNLGNLNTESSFGFSNRVPASSNVGNTGNSNRGTVGNSNANANSGSTFGNANQGNINSEPHSGSASIADRFHGGIELNNFPDEYENVRTNLNSGIVNSKLGDIKTNEY